MSPEIDSTACDEAALALTAVNEELVEASLGQGSTQLPEELDDEDRFWGRWWGEPWPAADRRAPICEDDRLRVPIPLGEKCMTCSEEIREGDRGVITHYIGADLQGGERPVHIECQMRMVTGGIGHLLGKCSCTGGECDPDDGHSVRESALLSWQLLQDRGSERD